VLFSWWKIVHIVFKKENKLWDILFLMPIYCWEMLKEELGVFGDIIKVIKVSFNRNCG